MRALSRKLDLLLNLAARDFKLRYRESVLGTIWAVLYPVVVLAVYTLVFSTIFSARWGGQPVVNKVDYAVLLFIGLIVYGIFAETVARAPTAILSNPGFVKKVVFPLEVLPGVVLLSTIYRAAMECVALFIFFCFSSFSFHIEALLFPLILAPFVVLVFGLALIFSSLGVFLRDFDQFAALLARLMMYMLPVLYPVTIFPQTVRTLIESNPMAVFIEQIRGLVIFGQMPEWKQFGIACMWSLLTLAIGSFWFQKTRKGFSDVI